MSSTRLTLGLGLLLALAALTLALWTTTQAPALAAPVPTPPPRAPSPRPFNPTPAPEPEAPVVAEPAQEAAPGKSAFAKVELRLVGPDGAPEPRASVWFTPLPGDDIVSHSASSDGWVVAWLKPGTWRLEGRGPGTAGPLELNLVAGQLVRHTLTFGGVRRVAGAVVDDSGAPISGATVRVGNQRYRVLDAFGRFSADVYDAEVDVTAEAEGYAPGALKVATPNENVHLVLKHGAWLSVSVVDETGAKVDDAMVDVSSLNFHAPDSTRNDPVHAFQELTVPSGVATVRALRLGRAGLERAREEVSLQPGERGAVTLRLKPGSGLEGVVLDPKGNPLAAVQVVALAVDGNPRRALTELQRSVMSAPTTAQDAIGLTHADGTFNLVPGEVWSPDRKYRVHVLGPGLREPWKPIFQELGGPPMRIELVDRGSP